MLFYVDHGTAYDLLYSFPFLLQPDIAVLEPGKVQDVFDQGMEPFSVCTDLSGQVVGLSGWIQHPCQNLRRPNDPGKRGAYIVRDGPKQVGSVSLSGSLLSGLDPLLGYSESVQGEGDAVDHGVEKSETGSVHLPCLLLWNAEYTQRIISSVKGPIVELLSLRGVSCHVFQPIQDRLGIFRFATELGFPFVL
jgi:hypothetical protein